MDRRRYWLWHAVVQEGNSPKHLVESRRGQHAAERVQQRVPDAEDGVEPRVVVTDKLASYAPVIKRVLTETEHRRQKQLNNRAEDSHWPAANTSERCRRFKSAMQAQALLETFSALCNHFRPRRHHFSDGRYGQMTRERFPQWQEIVQLTPTAW